MANLDSILSAAPVVRDGILAQTDLPNCRVLLAAEKSGRNRSDVIASISQRIDALAALAGTTVAAADTAAESEPSAKPKAKAKVKAEKPAKAPEEKPAKVKAEKPVKVKAPEEKPVVATKKKPVTKTKAEKPVTKAKAEPKKAAKAPSTAKTGKVETKVEDPATPEGTAPTTEGSAATEPAPVDTPASGEAPSDAPVAEAAAEATIEQAAESTPVADANAGTKKATVKRGKPAKKPEGALRKKPGKNTKGRGSGPRVYTQEYIDSLPRRMPDVVRCVVPGCDVCASEYEDIKKRFGVRVMRGKVNKQTKKEPAAFVRNQPRCKPHRGVAGKGIPSQRKRKAAAE